MKIKVINEKLNDKGKEFKARRMNYDQVVVNYPGKQGLETFDIEDVEFISEGEVDDILISHRHLLKIKINRGISILFYKYLMEQVEGLVEEELKDINLLKDLSTPANKRGFWEKELIMVLNSKYPVRAKISGQNFKRQNFKFDLKVLTEDEFEEVCLFEIQQLTKQIKWREMQLSHYGLAIEQVRKQEKNQEVKLLT